LQGLRKIRTSQQLRLYQKMLWGVSLYPHLRHSRVILPYEFLFL
jgi:hypothetical protein